MVIEKIAIKNLTVFGDTEIQLAKGVNVFIGENGTGKTHLLKFIDFIYKWDVNCYGESYIGSFDVHCKDLVRNKTAESSVPMFKIDFDIDSSNEDEKSIGFTIELPQGVSEKELQSIKEDEQMTCWVFGIEEIDDIESFYDYSIFIPAKDMLTHTGDYVHLQSHSSDMSFDETLLNIMKLSLKRRPNEIPDLARNITPILESIIDGKILVRDNKFFVKKTNGEEVSFNLEAEGLKKFGLLWQLLRNDSITKNTVLLWDEPEANINPKLIPHLVEILLELSRRGVQVFVTTHDYCFAKYFDVLKQKNDSIAFHSLFHDEDGIKCETKPNYRDLANNAIADAYNRMLDEVFDIEIKR